MKIKDIEMICSGQIELAMNTTKTSHSSSGPLPGPSRVPVIIFAFETPEPENCSTNDLVAVPIEEGPVSLSGAKAMIRLPSRLLSPGLI